MKLRARLQRFACCVAFVILLFTPNLRSQFVLIKVDKPFQSQKLAGMVVDPTGATVMGVLIEDCDPTFDHVKASTRTDKDGRFVLLGGRNGSTHFLSLSRDGFDPMHIIVKLRPSANSDLKIRLQIAT